MDLHQQEASIIPNIMTIPIMVINNKKVSVMDNQWVDLFLWDHHKILTGIN